jgi:hypothetical protein
VSGVSGLGGERDGDGEEPGVLLVLGSGERDGGDLRELHEPPCGAILPLGGEAGEEGC